MGDRTDDGGDRSWWSRFLDRLLRPATYQAVAAERTRTVLRWLMVFLVVGLGVAVLHQRWDSPGDCFQESISAYWYTPARAVFVASLVSIGVCLLALKGKTAAEDIMLNFAGLLAPVVAIVPTPPPAVAACDIPAGRGGQRAVDVANNMTALFVVGLLALVLAAVLAWRPGRGVPRASTGEKAAVLVAAGLWVLALVAFLAARDAFLATAHYAAAIPMFVAIVVVVAINALLTRRTGGRMANRYTAIVGLMLASTVVAAVAGLAGWDHAVIALETALITLFAIFWCLQTTSSDARMRQVVTNV